MVHDYYLSGACLENKPDKQKVELGKKRKKCLKK